MPAPGIEPKFSASGDSGDGSKRFKNIDFIILRTYRMKAIPAGPRVESNIGQHDTKRRSEHRCQGDFEANSAHSDVYSESSRTQRRFTTPTGPRVESNIGQHDTNVGTPISSRFRGKHRAQRRLQLWFLEKRKRAERNWGSQKHQKHCEVIQSSVSRRREHVFFRRIK